MMEDDLPITPTPRPADPFTSQDGLRLYSLIDSGFKRLEPLLSDFSNRLATMQLQIIKTNDMVKLIEADTADNRIKRLEIEIEEAERERQAAELALRSAQEKLQKRQTVKDENNDTGERLKQIAASAVTDAESKKKQSREEKLDEIKWAAVKAIATMLAVGFATGVIGFAWFLVQLYLNRGAP